MTSRSPVVRKRTKVAKSRLHDLLMLAWARAIADHGKGAFADALEISTVAVDKQLQGSMPSFDTIIEALTFRDDALDDVAGEMGLRVVPKEAICDVDDLNLLIGRVLVMVNEAVHPDGPGGRIVTHTEYLDGEILMRQLHAASGEWLEKCASIRRPRSVA